MPQQYIVRVQCAIAGRYDLPEKEYRIQASNPAIAVSRAWRMYKKQPQLARKRLDRFRFSAIRA